MIGFEGYDYCVDQMELNIWLGSFQWWALFSFSFFFFCERRIDFG